MVRVVGLAAIAVAAVAATGAMAQQRPSVVVNPDWLRRPTFNEVAELFPAMAALLDLRGYATLSCTVLASGRLSACEVEEKPAGLGFGDAALALSAHFRMTPKMVDGAPTDDGTVRIPIRFILPDAAVGASSAALAPKPSSREALELARELTRLTVSTKRIDASLDEALEDFAANGAVGVKPEAYQAGKAIIERTRVDLRARYLEGHALFLAAGLSAEDLKASIALHKRPGVVALRNEGPSLDRRLERTSSAYWQAVASDARSQVCVSRECTRAADAPPPPTRDWAETPDWAARRMADPAAAAMLRVEGHADLQCSSAANGVLQGCRIRAESPRGWGFGEAALTLAPFYRLKAPAGAGDAATLRVRFPATPFDPLPVQKAASLSPAQREVLAGHLGALLAVAREQRIKTLMDSPNLGSDAALVREVFEATETAAQANLGRLAEDQAAVYAETFSAAELEDIFALWSSPVDRKRERLWIEKASTWEPYGQAVTAEAWQAAQREFCQAHDCQAAPLP